MNPAKLFVGNISYQTTEDDLRQYFAAAGSIASCSLMFDKITGKSRGFAFVEYASPQEASKAIEMFHQKDFQGRALSVNVARPKEDRGHGGAPAPRSSSGESRMRA
jgi:cold-inducible RNA-binding protein